MLGASLTALKGHAGREVEQAYARARELCEQVDDTSRLFPLLLALGWFYLIRGSQDAARDVGARLLAMAETTRDPAFSLVAHHALGVASFYGGEFETALAHLERGIELYDPGAQPDAVRPRSASPGSGMSCMLHAGWALWVLGYPARAVVRLQEAIELAHSIDHPFSLAHGHRFGAVPPVAGGARRQPRTGRAEPLPCRPNMASAPSSRRRTSTGAGSSLNKGEKRTASR